MFAVVPVESAEATSQHGMDNSITKALDGNASTFYSSEPGPPMPVEVVLLLSGRYHVRKLDFIWKFDGPRDYTVSFSRWTGEQFDWLPVASLQNRPNRRDEEVFIGSAGYGYVTGAIKITARALNNSEFFGIQHINVLGVPAEVVMKELTASSSYSSDYKSNNLVT